MKEPQKPKASKKGSKAGAKFTGVSTHKTLTEFRLLYDNLPQKLFIKDRDSVYVSVNEKFAADLKVKPEEVAGKTDYDLFGKDFADKYRADDARIMESGKTEDIVENYIKEGEEIIVNTIKTPLKDKQGKVIGLLGAFWDITPYRRVEMQALRQNATLKAINDIFSKSMTCETEEQVGEACLSVAEKLTESAFSFIGKINPNGRFDTIALTNPGWADCKMPESEAPKLITNMEIRGIWGRVLKDGKPVIANEPKSHPDRRGVPEGHPPLTSFLGVPLKEGDRTEGMIALANKAEGYGPADQEAVEALALAVGQAVRAKRTESKVAQQAQEILELSTPLVQVWEGVVIAPLIGMLDSQRTQLFLERFLNAIVETRSPVALVDITGVPAVDTQTAQHLIEAITAARLLGTKVVLTGVSPSIAQTLVHLGIDLKDIETCSLLSSGLRVALSLLSLEVVKKKSAREDSGIQGLGSDY